MGKTDYQNQEQDRRIKWLEDHYSTFNEEMGNIKKSVEGIKTDIGWIKKMIWWVVGIVISFDGIIIAMTIDYYQAK